MVIVTVLHLEKMLLAHFYSFYIHILVILVENDLTIQAPIFIKEGEEILVNTETGDYGGRVTN